MSTDYTPTHTVSIDANQLADINNVLMMLSLSNENIILALQSIQITNDTSKAMVHTIVSALCLDNQSLESLSNDIDNLIAQAKPVATNGDTGGLHDE